MKRKINCSEKPKNRKANNKNSDPDRPQPRKNNSQKQYPPA